MIRFIDKYRNHFSVEFICKTLKNNRAGGFITSRGYRQSKARGLSARRLRDAVLVERIGAVHRDNYGVYGVRKMWHALRREGIDIGREQTARLMRLAGVSGKGKGGSPITTRKPNVPDLRPDLVEREFKAQGLKQAVGGRHYLRAHEERLCVWRICHRRLLPTDRRMGIIGLDAHRGITAASTQPSDCEREGNNRSYSPFGSRLAVRQRCLQPAPFPARDHCFHRNCRRLLRQCSS